MGKHKKAVALLEKVVAIRATTLEETHPNRLTSQHKLASAYKANGQVTEAIKLLEQVIEAKRLIFHKGHPSCVESEAAPSYFLQLI